MISIQTYFWGGCKLSSVSYHGYIDLYEQSLEKFHRLLSYIIFNRFMNYIRKYQNEGYTNYQLLSATILWMVLNDIKETDLVVIIMFGFTQRHKDNCYQWMIYLIRKRFDDVIWQIGHVIKVKEQRGFDVYLLVSARAFIKMTNYLNWLQVVNNLQRCIF